VFEPNDFFSDRHRSGTRLATSWRTTITSAIIKVSATVCCKVPQGSPRALDPSNADGDSEGCSASIIARQPPDQAGPPSGIFGQYGIGIIEQYTALLDASKVGVSLTVFARISLVSQDAETVERFATLVRKLPQVVECHIMAEESDALLRVVAADLDSYRQFQTAYLTRKNGVQSVKTDIPMQKIKLSTELPL
jgi:hypothetical protein